MTRVLWIEYSCATVHVELAFDFHREISCVFSRERLSCPALVGVGIPRIEVRQDSRVGFSLQETSRAKIDKGSVVGEPTLKDGQKPSRNWLKERKGTKFRDGARALYEKDRQGRQVSEILLKGEKIMIGIIINPIGDLFCEEESRNEDWVMRSYVLEKSIASVPGEIWCFGRRSTAQKYEGGKVADAKARDV